MVAHYQQFVALIRYGTQVVVDGKYAAVLVAQEALVDKQLLVDGHHEDVVLDDFVHFLIGGLKGKVLPVVLDAYRVGFLLWNQIRVGFPLVSLVVGITCTKLRLCLCSQCHQAHHCK